MDTSGPAILMLDIYSTGVTCTKMFTEALFIIVKFGNNQNVYQHLSR